VSKQSRRDREALETLEGLYRLIPSIPCRRLCADACGALILTDLEARRLQAETHIKPRTLPVISHPSAGRCVYLAPAQDRCTVHAIRPLICRVWGVLKRLSCPHGCTPSTWLSDVQFLALARAVEKIGGGRIVRTSPAGLEHAPGESFSSVSTPRRPVAEIYAEAELVRGLRAIHGGRILAAVRTDD